MKYKIIKAWSHDQLENRIDYMLSKGWELQGGVSMTVLECEVQYAQAMIKHDDVNMNIRASKKVNTISLREFLDSKPA
jgi:hypothetical protein